MLICQSARARIGPMLKNFNGNPRNTALLYGVWANCADLLWLGLSCFQDLDALTRELHPKFDDPWPGTFRIHVHLFNLTGLQGFVHDTRKSIGSSRPGRNRAGTQNDNLAWTYRINRMVYVYSQWMPTGMDIKPLGKVTSTCVVAVIQSQWNLRYQRGWSHAERKSEGVNRNQKVEINQHAFVFFPSQSIECMWTDLWKRNLFSGD
jgi:hypothetical protein